MVVEFDFFYSAVPLVGFVIADLLNSSKSSLSVVNL